MENPNSQIIKKRIHIIMLGESHVGKTALVRRYFLDFISVFIDFIMIHLHRNT